MVTLCVRFVLQAQVAAYTQWVNIQLKRRPGSRPIDELKRDMQDGVALAHLIEIIGKQCSAFHNNHENAYKNFNACSVIEIK